MLHRFCLPAPARRELGGVGGFGSGSPAAGFLCNSDAGIFGFGAGVADNSPIFFEAAPFAFPASALSRAFPCLAASRSANFEDGGAAPEVAQKSQSGRGLQ